MQHCDNDFIERRHGERRSDPPFCITDEGIDLIAERAADKALAKLAGMFRLMWIVAAGCFAVFVWMSKKGLI